MCRASAALLSTAAVVSGSGKRCQLLTSSSSAISAGAAVVEDKDGIDHRLLASSSDHDDDEIEVEIHVSYDYPEPPKQSLLATLPPGLFSQALHLMLPDTHPEPAKYSHRPGKSILKTHHHHSSASSASFSTSRNEDIDGQPPSSRTTTPTKKKKRRIRFKDSYLLEQQFWRRLGGSGVTSEGTLPVCLGLPAGPCRLVPLWLAEEDIWIREKELRLSEHLPLGGPQEESEWESDSQFSSTAHSLQHHQRNSPGHSQQESHGRRRRSRHGSSTENESGPSGGRMTRRQKKRKNRRMKNLAKFQRRRRRHPAHELDPDEILPRMREEERGRVLLDNLKRCLQMLADPESHIFPSHPSSSTSTSASSPAGRLERRSSGNRSNSSSGGGGGGRRSRHSSLRGSTCNDSGVCDEFGWDDSRPEILNTRTPFWGNCPYPSPEEQEMAQEQLSKGNRELRESLLEEGIPLEQELGTILRSQNERGCRVRRVKRTRRSRVEKVNQKILATLPPVPPLRSSNLAVPVSKAVFEDGHTLPLDDFRVEPRKTKKKKKKKKKRKTGKNGEQPQNGHPSPPLSSPSPSSSREMSDDIPRASPSPPVAAVQIPLRNRPYRIVDVSAFLPHSSLYPSSTVADGSSGVGKEEWVWVELDTDEEASELESEVEMDEADGGEKKEDEEEDDEYFSTAEHSSSYLDEYHADESDQYPLSRPLRRRSHRRRHLRHGGGGRKRRRREQEQRSRLLYPVQVIECDCQTGGRCLCRELNIECQFEADCSCTSEQCRNPLGRYEYDEKFVSEYRTRVLQEYN